MKRRTYIEDVIEKGYKKNSMYEPNTIYDESTKEEMEQFYIDTKDLTSRQNMKPNAMKFYNINNIQRKKSLIIKLEEKTNDNGQINNSGKLNQEPVLKKNLKIRGK